MFFDVSFILVKLVNWFPAQLSLNCRPIVRYGGGTSGRQVRSTQRDTENVGETMRVIMLYCQSVSSYKDRCRVCQRYMDIQKHTEGKCLCCGSQTVLLLIVLQCEC